jgi:hypothetical protein
MSAKPARKIAPPTQASGAASRVGQAVLAFMADMPHSKEHTARSPREAARSKANAAAAKAALAAGALALPPGPAAWLTLLPELIGVWNIQRQLVADIAALYGKKASLTPEQVVYCLFRHTAAQGLRDLVVRVGERVLVRRASPLVMRAITQRIGVKVTQRALGKGLARRLPIVGAVGVGAYAYYDTAQVAATAIELFEREIDLVDSNPT